MQVFEGESVFHYQQAPSANVEVPLALKRDAAVTVMIKVRNPFLIDIPLGSFASVAWRHRAVASTACRASSANTLL